jgi:hypothetical protein
MRHLPLVRLVVRLWELGLARIWIVHLRRGYATDRTWKNRRAVVRTLVVVVIDSGHCAVPRDVLVLVVPIKVFPQRSREAHD